MKYSDGKEQHVDGNERRKKNYITFQTIISYNRINMIMI